MLQKKGFITHMQAMMMHLAWRSRQEYVDTNGIMCVRERERERERERDTKNMSSEI